MTSQEQSRMITGINVTPLVDITLVLLIIFMVTAKLAVTSGVPLDLPRAAQAQAVQSVFAVVMPAGGPARVSEQTIESDAMLVRLARDAIARDPETRALILAEGAVPHARVLHTLDLLQRAGLSRVAFGAVPEPAEEP